MGEQNDWHVSNGELIDYWSELLSDYEDNIGIEGARKNSEYNRAKNQIVTLSFQESLQLKLELLTSKLEINMNTLFELAWGILLQKYNNVNDVVFGELYISKKEILPVRIKTDEKTQIGDLLWQLISQLKISRQHKVPSRYWDFNTKIFETVIIYNELVNESINVQWDVYQDIPYSKIIVVIDKKEQYKVSIVYDSNCYDENNINYILQVYSNIVMDIAEHPDKKVLEIQALSSKMKNDIIYKFNHKLGKIKYETIAELFYKHVSNNPDKTALLMEQERMSYRELNLISDQVAYRLVELGIQRNDFVALYTERSFQMIIAMLAILKVGAAFVPIHLDFSNERIDYILADCNAKLIITYKENLRLETLKIKIPMLDLSCQDMFIESYSRGEKYVGSDVAFVIYTSGTTGKPKGIVGTHLSLLSAALTDISNYGLKETDVILQYSNYTYIQAISDIYSTFAIGGTLCLISNESVHDFSMIEKCCNENHVTKVSLTPSIINGLNPENCLTLRIIDSTGEPSDVEVLKRWLVGREIYNSYGTTEVVTVTSSFHYTGEGLINVPIGKPSLYSTYYILDNYGNLCGVGMIGELYIGGIALSKGYINNPQLTEKQFVINPYTGEKLYRTGDLARWKIDGNVECLKRIDDQIKICGKRIELDEIRGALRRIEKVKDCAVFVWKDNTGGNKIYAYYTSDKIILKAEMRNSLLDYIPEYMIPSYIEQVDKIPVNKNGKVDKKDLLDLANMRVAKFVAPTTKEEILLEHIFCKVFCIEQISIDDSFYDLGGDSISAIHVASQLFDYNYQVTAMNIMRDSTIRKIAKRMNSYRKSDFGENNINNAKSDIKVSASDLSIISDMFQ